MASAAQGELVKYAALQQNITEPLCEVAATWIMHRCGGFIESDIHDVVRYAFIKSVRGIAGSIYSANKPAMTYSIDWKTIGSSWLGMECVLLGIFDTVGGVLRRGFLWWIGELGDLLPAGANTPRSPKTDATVLVDEGGRLEVLHAPRRLTAASGGATATQVLMQLVKARPNAKVTLQVSPGACLQRSIELPKAARRQAQSILALDLERATPFKVSDVLTGFTLSASERKGWLKAIQVITKRRAVERAVQDIEALGLAVARITTQTAGTDVNLKSGGVRESASGGGRSWAVPAALALILATTCVWLSISRREAALSEVEAQLAQQRQRTADTLKRTASAQSQAKEAQAIISFANARRQAAEVIDDLTRLLPDDVYLETLAMEGDTLEIAGLAKSASAVVPLLERSTAFKDVESLAPITFDGTAQKEHFSFRVKVRGEIASASATHDGAEGAMP